MKTFIAMIVVALSSKVAMAQQWHGTTIVQGKNLTYDVQNFVNQTSKDQIQYKNTYRIQYTQAVSGYVGPPNPPWSDNFQNYPKHYVHECLHHLRIYPSRS